MMEHLRWTAIAMLVLLFLFPAREADAKSFTIDQVDINAYVMDNGDLYVEELYTYSFSGIYNGTTRTIGTDNNGGVDFFEGYLAPDDTKLSRYDPSTFQQLNVEREKKTFKIHTTSEDETKKIFYRYLIKDAANKYKDTGELYWRFFDQTNVTDLQNLRIRLILNSDRNATLAGHAYLHSPSGELKKSPDEGFIYSTDLLKAGDQVEIRFLFTEAFLENMAYTKDKEMRSKIEKEEAGYEGRQARRAVFGKIIGPVNLVVSSILFLLLLFSIFYPRRLMQLIQSKPPLHQLEEADSFLMALIEKRGLVKPSAITAALLRLRQRGIVAMEKVKPNAVFSSDAAAPGYTFQFTLLNEDAPMSDSEKDLVSWLFVKGEDGVSTFSLDQFPFLSRQQLEANSRYKEDYKFRAKAFRERFKKWQAVVKNDPEVREYISPNPFRHWLTRAGVPLWIVWIGLNVWASSPGNTDIIVILLILFGGWLYIMKTENSWANLPLYLFFTSIIAFSIDTGLPNLCWTGSMFLLLSSLFLPMNDILPKGMPYFKGMKTFRREVWKGTFDMESRGRAMERWAEHAIALNLCSPLLSHYGKNLQEELAVLPAFTTNLAELATAFQYTHRHQYMYMSSGSGSGSSGSSGGSGGGGGAGAF